MFSLCGKAKTLTMLYGVYSLQMGYNSGESRTFALTVSARVDAISTPSVPIWESATIG